MSTRVDLTLESVPRIQSRLLRPGAERESLDQYVAAEGLSDGLRGADLLAAIDSAGLVGRGGAAFPLARKINAVSGSGNPCVVVANGEEGEPASVKDRWLLRRRPHLVLDGLLRVADAMSAERSVVYVSDGEAAQSIRTALAELGDKACSTELFIVDASYVAGEETSAVRAINGGPALPVDKPPRPFESGVDDRPTLVSNVETLAHVSWIARHGADMFRAVGTPSSPGTFLMTVSGACRRPGLYEVPLGISLGEALDQAGGADGEPRAFLMGGFFAGALGPHALDTQLCYDELRALGSGLGCGAVVVIGPDDCVVAAIADVMAYLAGSSAQQCGACIRGTAAMSDVAAALGRGEATDEQLDKLSNWSTRLLRRGACGLLDGAAYVAASLLREFPDTVDEHRRGPCARCAVLMPDVKAGFTRFRVDANEMTKEAL
ncbi:NADH-ubiquinone oxidoreductase-F iron-sulfur binding region domain-containing protein [Mycobacterium sp. 94-17]|uniref:NADH-ubiquinone oxidoreductase-F iron-sulfur binding region domain-containing protein n=1 Tax=Mycobacterium sp. 94-17 TaxID=2986147 RepID=UPI003B63434E